MWGSLLLAIIQSSDVTYVIAQVNVTPYQDLIDDGLRLHNQAIQDLQVCDTNAAYNKASTISEYGQIIKSEYGQLMQGDILINDANEIIAASNALASGNGYDFYDVATSTVIPFRPCGVTMPAIDDGIVYPMIFGGIVVTAAGIAAKIKHSKKKKHTQSPYKSQTPQLLRSQEPPGGRPIFSTQIPITVNPVTGQQGIYNNQIRSNVTNPNVGMYGLVRTNLDGTPRRHDGIDILAPRGTDIHPARSGRVTFAGTISGYGNIVHIDHGNGLVTRYAHLDSINVQVGQNVNPTDVIGQTGTSGNAQNLPVAEQHLHFEVQSHGVTQNPINFLNNP